jgi:hypothetical protein
MVEHYDYLGNAIDEETNDYLFGDAEGEDPDDDEEYDDLEDEFFDYLDDEEDIEDSISEFDEEDSFF